MTYTSQISALAPILWWRLNEAAGTTLTASAGALNGTYSGSHTLGRPSLISDGSGGTSVLFEGGEALSPNTTAAYGRNLTGVFTATAWVRYDGASPLTSGNRRIVALGSNWGIGALAPEAYGGQSGTNGQPGLYMQHSPGAGWDRFGDPDFNLYDGTKHFVVAEWDADAGTRRLYVNGSLLAYDPSYVVSSVTLGSTPRFQVGAWADPIWMEIDEVALFDKALTPAEISSLWWAGSGGELVVQSVPLKVTLPAPHVAVGQHVPVPAIGLTVTFGDHALSEPMRPASIDDSDTVTGPIASYQPGALYVGSIGTLDDEVTGPVVPVTPTETQILRPMSVASMSSIPGPWIPQPVVIDADPKPIRPIPIPVPVSPTYPEGILYIEGAMTVGGATNVTAADCRPTLNGVGSGSFTRKGSVSDIGATIQFRVAGRATMTGVVTETRDAQVDSGEEASQLQTMTVAATAHELAKVLVLPDFGAMDLTRIGPPTQDVRVFDWTANGIGDWSGDGNLYTPGAIPPPQTSAIGVDALQADYEELIPLPDVWPDNSSQWIWWISPRIPAGKGWALFRVPTPKPPQGPTQFWLCAYDYAELWVDGVKAVVCDTPGKAMHIQIEDLRSDHHLLAIRAYTRGGRAGVMCSMLPVKPNGLYGTPTMNSRSGWVAIPYQDAFIYTPGAVIQRIFYEAKQRGDFPSNDWKLNFTNQLDSNGVPWPIPEWPIEIDVGVSILDVLNRLAGDMIDWSESPSGRELNAYIKGTGTGESHNLPWTQAVDLSSKGVAKMERV